MKLTLAERVRFAVQRYYVKRLGRSPVHVLHIGKTGGTAIKHALSNMPGNKRRGIFIHRHGMTLSDVPSGEKVVAFVRDPAARFVSGFNSRKRRGQPRIYVEWSDDERKAFDRFQTPNDLAEALSSPNDEQRAFAANAMSTIQHVRSPHGHWLGKPGYLAKRDQDILLIGRQETLSDDIRRFAEVTNLDPALVTLPTDPVDAHKTPNNMDIDLTPKARANLTDWYAEDYELLKAVDELRERRGWV